MLVLAKPASGAVSLGGNNLGVVDLSCVSTFVIVCLLVFFSMCVAWICVWGLVLCGGSVELLWRSSPLSASTTQAVVVGY